MERIFLFVFTVIILIVTFTIFIQIVKSIMSGYTEALVPLSIYAVFCIITICYSIYKFVNCKNKE